MKKRIIWTDEPVRKRVNGPVLISVFVGGALFYAGLYQLIF